MSKSLILVLALLVTIIVLLALLLRKVRQVHIATFELREHAVETRRETESLFTQLTSLSALERTLDLGRALPILRGWAGSPDFLLALAGEVLDSRPKTMMECSSGASTLVLARCAQLNGAGHVYSLEHDPIFAAKTRVLLEQNGLSTWATVLDAPLQRVTTSTPWYDLAAVPADLPPVDLLVVDGPPQQVAALARMPAVPQLVGRMAARAVVFVDDADRDDERQMVRRWCAEFPEFQRFQLPAEKGLVVLRRSGPVT